MSPQSFFSTCIVCGYTATSWKFQKIISDDLARTWKLDPHERQLFDLRESSFCPSCWNSARNRVFAKSIMSVIPFSKAHTFSEWVQLANKKKLRVAEINACGKLHRYLTRIDGLAYSEYPSERLLPRLYYMLKNVRKEDITNLSYRSNSFDLVVHTEVFEHIDAVEKAITECRRILKPHGVCLFTIPYMPDRKTIKRAVRDPITGAIVHKMPPSFHGLDQRSDNLVWWEFGGDFARKYTCQIVFSDLEWYTYVFALKK